MVDGGWVDVFLRKTKRREPVPVTMSGVQMGEKLLQVGLDDAAIAGAIAAKVGLSGSAAAAVDSEALAVQARRSAADAGVLVDVQVAPFDRLPFDDGAFDVIVVHSSRGLLWRTAPDTRTAAAREWHRALRHGGRVVTIEPGPRSGLTGMFRGGAATDPAYDAAGGTPAVLQSGGFRAVRTVGQLEGFTFIEGLKS
jgi:demethylmenaquinone methyltransferase/2-methoxy-6-polyprenyl-1,4-benzoquinol methylase